MKKGHNIPNKRIRIKHKDNCKQITTTECKSKSVMNNVLKTTLKNQKNSAKNNVNKEKDETNRKLQKCSILKIKTNFKLLKCELLLQN